MNTVRNQLYQWFETAPGQLLLQFEQQQLENILPGLFGYHAIQLGQLPGESLIAASPVGHKVLIGSEPDTAVHGSAGLVCLGESLPLAPDSVDVLLLPHVLEFEQRPHQVLRECERVLIGEGHLVIIGFNPWSLHGIWRLLAGWREQAPWSGQYFSAARLQDWLRLLDFELVQLHKFFYRPPLRSDRMLQRLGFLDTLGRWCWPGLGGVYLIVARKRVIPMTPVRELWKHRRRLIASGLEPVRRLKS